MINAAQQHITALEKKVGPDARSPLFAQLAYYYLASNRAQDALRVCDSGLANYPFFATGHLLKGKALAAMNMLTEARREFEFVHEFLPNSQSIKSLLAEVPPAEEEKIDGMSSEPHPEQNVPFGYSVPDVAPSGRIPEVDYGFGEHAAPPATYTETPSGSSFFEAITKEPAAPPPPEPETAPVEQAVAAPPATPENSPLIDFSFPVQDAPPAFVPAVSSASTSESDLILPSIEAMFSAQPHPVAEEPFDQFAERMRTKLAGADSITMDEYFNTAVGLQLPGTEPGSIITTGGSNTIEELTSKLQGAGKITPVINFSQKETPTASDQDTPAGAGFVTPTLAEIYAKQGWYDDAIKAYKTLARNKPAEKERFEKRIVELEELKRQSGTA